MNLTTPSIYVLSFSTSYNICYAQSTDSDNLRILLREPQIRAFAPPRIAHAYLGSEDLLRKPRICGFCCANLGFAGNHLGSRNQISSIRGNKPTIDRARKLNQLRHPRQRGFIAANGRADLCARSIVASLPRWPNCFACAIDRGFVDAYAELLCVRDRSWVCCRGWPRFGCAILEDCVRI